MIHGSFLATEGGCCRLHALLEHSLRLYPHSAALAVGFRTV